MTFLKQKIPKSTKLQILLISLAFLLAIIAVAADVAFKGPLTSLLSDRQKITEIIQKFGIFAPLCYMLLQATQTVIAPIPGQVTGLVGGYLFGWWGILWTVIGSAFGFFIVFTLARRFGRPLVEKIIKKEHLDRFDFIAGKKAPIILFIIFLLPGFPDDVVCYVAGLTEIPIKQLMAMIIIGRLPAVIMTNIFGDSIGNGDFLPLFIITILTALLLSLALIFKKPLMNYFKTPDNQP